MNQPPNSSLFAVIKIVQIEKFLRDISCNSISPLNIPAFHMKVPYIEVPYRNKCVDAKVLCSYNVLDGSALMISNLSLYKITFHKVTTFIYIFCTRFSMHGNQYDLKYFS